MTEWLMFPIEDFSGFLIAGFLIVTVIIVLVLIVTADQEDRHD